MSYHLGIKTNNITFHDIVLNKYEETILYVFEEYNSNTHVYRQFAARKEGGPGQDTRGIYPTFSPAQCFISQYDGVENLLIKLVGWIVRMLGGQNRYSKWS